MCDQQRGAPLQQTLKRLFNVALTFRVETRGGLVEDDHGRIFQKHPRDRNALPLAAGELHATLSHARVPLLGEALNEFPRVRRLRRAQHVGIAGIRARIRNVVTDGATEEHRFLRHNPNRTAQRVE